MYDKNVETFDILIHASQNKSMYESKRYTLFTVF